MKKKKGFSLANKKKEFISLMIGIALLVGGMVWYVAPRGAQALDEFQFDEEAMAGRLSTLSEEELMRELNDIVEQGMFHISIASNIVVPTPDSEAELRIENVPRNLYHMQVTLRLDEEQEYPEITLPAERVLYESKGLKPGTYIETAKLTQKLTPGIYNATATFTAFDQESYQRIGQANAKVYVTVLEGLN